jgi:cytochrome c5
MKALVIFLFAIAVVVRGADASANPVSWDALEKSSEPKAGERAAAFRFTARNTSDKPVTILQVRPSCGCTIVDLPADPWVLKPGASGSLMATVDLSGKEGNLVKMLFVDTSFGRQTLVMNVKMPVMAESDRLRNQQVATANRQAVFQNECALCHAVPAIGKQGQELFEAACGVCHIGPHRASMVPDLLVAREPRDAAFWKKWISEGREGSLMPGFAESHGGPLSDSQIDSLVKFALEKLPTEPPAK